MLESSEQKELALTGGAMRWMSGLLILAGVAAAQESSMQLVGNMSQLMINIIYPTSNAVFYVYRTPPKNEEQWGEMETNALMLAESGNLLMMAGRARDQDKWMKDSKLLVDVGAAAFKAAKARDTDALLALNEQLNTACVTCHQDYRPNYRRRQTK
jgi:hypothetical protein